MSDDFLGVDQKMHEFMKNLLDAPLLTRKNLKGIPSKGVYVFYEKDKPIYVGISGKNRMKDRILGHSQKSGGPNSATFVFYIAKKEAEKNGMNTKEFTRPEIADNKEFTILYSQAKERVSKMKVRVIEIKDPNYCALFEIYAAIVLDTLEYNSFETH